MECYTLLYYSKYHQRIDTIHFKLHSQIQYKNNNSDQEPNQEPIQRISDKLFNRELRDFAGI